MHHAPMFDRTPLERAIAATGGDDAFCHALRIKRRSLFYWKSGRLPAERVGQIAKITGIPVHELRPDIFPAPEDAASKPGATQDAA